MSTAIDTRTVLLLASLLEWPDPDALQRQCQHRATQLLASLLASDTPTITWRIPSGLYPHLQVDDPTRHPSLDGQATSHQAVRDFADHLGTEVVFAFGHTPTAVAVIDGIGVRVWCGPDFRDDTDANGGRVT